MQVISHIIEEATKKFGYVHGIAKNANGTGFTLVIERYEPPHTNAPFMTIRAYAYDFPPSMETERSKVAFEHGFYDITRQTAFDDMGARASKI